MMYGCKTLGRRNRPNSTERMVRPVTAAEGRIENPVPHILALVKRKRDFFNFLKKSLKVGVV